MCQGCRRARGGSIMAFQRKGAVVNRRTVLKGMGAAGAMGALGFPAIVRAQG
jgi:hypothetical protein